VFDSESWFSSWNVEGESVLYELTEQGKAALRIDEKSIEEFLKIAIQEKLSKFNEAYSDS
jgi:hypothetical protein